jgi:hypothetical protein
MDFKVGDRVTRDERDMIGACSSKKILHGTIARAYNDWGMFGFYPELYDVIWDNNEQKYSKGYLPFGLRKEA